MLGVILGLWASLYIWENNLQEFFRLQEKYTFLSNALALSLSLSLSLSEPNEIENLDGPYSQNFLSLRNFSEFS